MPTSRRPSLRYTPTIWARLLVCRLTDQLGGEEFVSAISTEAA